MSHIIVGERLGRLNPEMVGHVVRGAGHLIQTVGGWMQSGASNAHSIPNVAERSINTLTGAQAADNWQWAQLHTNYGSGAFTASANAYGTPDYLKGLDFTFAGQEDPIDFSKGMDCSRMGQTTLSYGLDMHYDGPGSEAEQLHDHYRDTQNREAADRVNNGSRDPQDQQRANDYYRDHSA